MWNPRRRQDLWCFWALWFSPDAAYQATVSISRKDRWWRFVPSQVTPCSSPPSPRAHFVRSRIAVWTSAGRGCLCYSLPRGFSRVPFSRCSRFQPCPVVHSRYSMWPRRKVSGRVYLWFDRIFYARNFLSLNFHLAFYSYAKEFNQRSCLIVPFLCVFKLDERSPVPCGVLGCEPGFDDWEPVGLGVCPPEPGGLFAGPVGLGLFFR